MVFLNQKVDRNMIFTDHWKVLVLTISAMGNTVFFEPKSRWKDDIYWLLKSSCIELFNGGKSVFFESRSWLKDDIYWLLKSSCFELSGDGKYGLCFSKKVDGKMTFPWSFLAFHDIPGLGKYGFSRSVALPNDQRFSCFCWKKNCLSFLSQVGHSTLIGSLIFEGEQLWLVRLKLT